MSEYDKIIVEGLILLMSVGINEAEKTKPQKVCLNLVIDVLNTGDTKKRTIKDVLCYQQLTDRIRSLAASGHFDLIEDFAESITSLCLTDQRAIAAKVSVFKTEIMKDTRKVGIEIYRKKH